MLEFLLKINVDTSMSWIAMKWRFSIEGKEVLRASWEVNEKYLNIYLKCK